MKDAAEDDTSIWRQRAEGQGGGVCGGADALMKGLSIANP